MVLDDDDDPVKQFLRLQEDYMSKQIIEKEKNQTAKIKEAFDTQTKLSAFNPPIISRALPNIPSSLKVKAQNNTRKSVVRTIIDQLDQHGNIRDILPLLRNTCEAKPTQEIFPAMDEETRKSLNEYYNADIAQRKKIKEMTIEDEDDDERPKSPGQEYDKHFIPAEIGIREPQFRARAHAEVYRNLMSKGDLKKLVTHAESVEKSLRSKYKRYKMDHRTIADEMVKKYKEQKRKKKILNQPVESTDQQ